MLAETFLALTLGLGPTPGRTLYSQIPVDEDAPRVALAEVSFDGRKVKAYQLVGAEPPPQCAQPQNPACRAPRLDPELKRWQRPETFDEGLRRYWQIARIAGDLVRDRAELGYVFTIVRHESGLRRDVHEGTNHRPHRLSTIHEDAGRSWCLGQIMVSRSPRGRLPEKRYHKRTAGELVGLDDAATRRCLEVVTTRVRGIMRHCAKRSGGKVYPSCVFTSYAGTAIRATHPLIRARLGTHAKVRAFKGGIGPDIRARLGLPPAKKKKTAARGSFGAWRSSIPGHASQSTVAPFGFHATRSRWTACASHTPPTSCALLLPSSADG